MNLPKEILLLVLSFLPSEKVVYLRVLSSQIKEWIDSSQVLWKILYQRDFGVPHYEIKDWKVSFLEARTPHFHSTLMAPESKRSVDLLEKNTVAVVKKAVSASTYCLLFGNRCFTSGMNYFEVEIVKGGSACICVGVLNSKKALKDEIIPLFDGGIGHMKEGYGYYASGHIVNESKSHFSGQPHFVREAKVGVLVAFSGLSGFANIYFYFNNQQLVTQKKPVGFQGMKGPFWPAVTMYYEADSLRVTTGKIPQLQVQFDDAEK